MARSSTVGLAIVLLSAACDQTPLPSVCVEGFAGKDAGPHDARRDHARDAGPGDAGTGGAGPDWTGTGGAEPGDARLRDAGPGHAGVPDAGSYGSRCQAPASCGTVQNASIKGPTGVAASVLHADKNAYYLVDGYPDVQARFFAMDETGTDLGTYSVSTGGAFPDWEDIAVGPCPGGSCVFLADIGNASGGTQAIYRVREPSTLAAGTSSVTADVFPFVYPDGPHDAATLLVHPVTGVMTILTRDQTGTGTLAYELPAAAPGQMVTATPRGSVQVGLGVAVTGGSVRSDGLAVLLRTNADATRGALLFEAAPVDGGKAPAALPLDAKPCAMTVASETDGESIAWMGSSGGFLTLDHTASAALHYVFCAGR